MPDVDDPRPNISEAIAKGMAKYFVDYLVIGWNAEGKWLCTVSNSFDKERMKNLRDWLTRQIDQDGS